MAGSRHADCSIQRPPGVRMLKPSPADREPASQTRDPYEGAEPVSPGAGPRRARDLLRSSHEASDGPMSDPQEATAEAAPDDVLTQLLGEVARDPHSVGLLLGGSRAFGTASPGST